MKKTSKFLIGIFVIGAVVIAAAGMIWLGALSFLKSGRNYVSFFDQSVEGVQVDTPVKFRGVEIGRVSKIMIAPDDRLVEIVMTIYRKGIIRPNTMARITSAGFTGQTLIDLAPGSPQELKQSPRVTFPVRYPVIPTRPSRVGQLEAGAAAVIGKLESLDLQGLVGQIKSTTSALHEILSGPRMNGILTNLESGSARFNRAVAGSEKLISRLDGDLQAMKLAETAQRADLLIGELERKSRDIVPQIEEASRNLRGVTENLDLLFARLRASPSDVIWSSPPPVRNEK